MNSNEPDASDALDLREVWRRQYPNFGPAWAALVDSGADVTQLLQNLSLTVEQRLEQLEQMARFFEQTHGAALATKP